MCLFKNVKLPTIHTNKTKAHYCLLLVHAVIIWNKVNKNTKIWISPTTRYIRANILEHTECGRDAMRCGYSARVENVAV